MLCWNKIFNWVKGKKIKGEIYLSDNVDKCFSIQRADLDCKENSGIKKCMSTNTYINSFIDGNITFDDNYDVVMVEQTMKNSPKRRTLTTRRGRRI